MRYFYKATLAKVENAKFASDPDHPPGEVDGIKDGMLVLEVDLGFHESVMIACHLVGVKPEALVDEDTIAFIRGWFVMHGPVVHIESFLPEAPGAYLVIVNTVERPNSGSLNEAVMDRGWPMEVPRGEE